MPERQRNTEGSKPNIQMNAIGYLIAAGLLVLALPLLPFLLVYIVFDRLLGSGDGGGEEPVT
jgi:hypothetical protein